MKLWLCDKCVAGMNKRRKKWKTIAGAIPQRGQCDNCDKITQVKRHDDSQGS